MRKLALLAFIAIVGGFFYLVRDVGHIPALDANLNVLAESREAGYCAGVVWWETRDNPTAKQTAECRESNDLSSEVDMRVVQESFCDGIVDAGWPSDPTFCLAIMQEQKLWPLFDGGFTDKWSKANPYPGDRMLDVSSESRTGEREGFER